MSQPGWYPDPAGQPGQFRYWDGASWSQQTSSSPVGGGNPGGAGRRNNSNGAGRWVGIVVALVVVVLLVVMTVRLFNPRTSVDEDTNTSTPTVSAWDETSSPTPEPTPSDPRDTGGKPVECPDHYGASKQNPGEVNGRYSGGGLSYQAIPGWEARQGWGVDWAYDRDGQWDRVSSSWVSLALVGQIDREHFPNPKTAAGQLMSCLASSYYYRTITERKDVTSEAITVDGKQGWKLVSDIHCDHPDVKGDTIQIVVLDLGREGLLSIFVSEAPIGDADRNAKTQAALASLKVEA